MVDMTQVLASTRWFPCHHRRARFLDLMVTTRRCPLCKESWQVTFESAPAASAMTGQVVWRARWTAK